MLNFRYYFPQGEFNGFFLHVIHEVFIHVRRQRLDYNAFVNAIFIIEER